MPQHQYSLALIQREVNNSVISQRTSDGYINASDLCRAAGKQWYQYRREETTGHFLRALASKTNVSEAELTQEVTMVGEGASIWVHPKVAIHLAQWLSADFAVQVADWVYEWASGGGRPAPAQLPPHLNRYLHNDPSVPQGYFSILQETGLGLFGPLHNLGFEIPKDWVPDISVGKCYCGWLRERHGIDTDQLPTYEHDYLDGRALVYPKAYPEELLPDFRNWFRTVWLPENGVQYFKRKDPSSLAYLDRLPALSAPKQRPRLRQGPNS